MGGCEIAWHGGAAARFEIRGTGQVEPIQPRHGGFHVGEVYNLLGQRTRVLFLEGFVQRVQTILDPQKARQTVHHIHVLQILIFDIERGLAGLLQRVQQAHLKALQLVHVFFEFFLVKGDLRCAVPFDICQLPLARGFCDLPADVAFGRIAGQDDLGATLVLHHPVKQTRIVVVEIAKAVQPFGRLDPPQQSVGVRDPFRQCHAQRLGPVGVADELGVKRLPVAGDAIKGVQVRFQKIGPGSHFGKHNEVVKRRHGLTDQIGLTPRRTFVDR